MQKSESVASLLGALSKAQGEIDNAKKASVNPFFKSKYADLAEVINVSKDALSVNGLSVSQFPSYEGGVVSITTVIGHASGEWMESTMSAPADKVDVQSLGKIITYLRRYSYSAVLGIAQEDDDGNDAVKHAPKVVYITADQVKTLSSMIELSETDSSRFLGYFKIAEVAQLPVSRFDEALKMLNAKLDNKAKEGEK